MTIKRKGKKSTKKKATAKEKPKKYADKVRKYEAESDEEDMPKQKKTRGLREEPGVHRIPRQLSAYNIYQQNLMRQGYSMKEAAQMWNELQQDIGKEEED